MTPYRETRTPGKWAVIRPGDGTGITVGVDTTSRKVCVCVFDHAGSTERINPMEAYANAELIATAPEMHAMLNKVLNRLGEHMTPKMLNDIKLLVRKGGTHRVM